MLDKMIRQCKPVHHSVGRLLLLQELKHLGAETAYFPPILFAPA